MILTLVAHGGAALTATDTPSLKSMGACSPLIGWPIFDHLAFFVGEAHRNWTATALLSVYG
jgi:hypothetical protein